ncbi:MAG TPA: amidohydrolase family protein [Desulfatiglandales bacterium]|nr:amidohydrolase family protein [Desulfatiglandales bacterium]
MKIDIYTHVLPTKYKKALYKYSDKFETEKNFIERRITLTDHNERIRIINKYEDVVQVLSVNLPPLEEIVDQKEAAELARIANDEMAELVAKYPTKYIAAIAHLPLNNMEAAMKEAERAIRELGFKGIQIFTSIQGKPLGSDEFLPLYKMMTDLDLPIWIHPLRRSSVPDYPTEDASFYQLFSIFGWPYETTAAMTRLVFAGILEKFPTIKFITHHCGGMIPYYADRIVNHYNNGLERLGQEFFPGLTKHPIEYFRMFYNDTALNGGTSGLMCGYDFFGEDHLLFGSDMPFDVENGAIAIRKTIEAIEGMNISESSKKKIYEGNARNLLHL